MTLTAVWGSPDAGKTTVALALGAAWANQHKDVLILGVDACVPSLTQYLPRNNTLTDRHSIGGLLEAPTPTEAGLKDRIHRHPKSDHLYFMGHVSGELPPIHYRPPERGTLGGLFQLLRLAPFAHVIVDCSSNPVFDSMTLYALEYADVVVRVLTPDVKGYEFNKAQLAWMGNGESFRADRHLKVLNPIRDYTPVKEVEALFGSFDFSLPYIRPVAERVMAGELLTGMEGGAAHHFERTAAALAAKIEEEVSQNE